MGTLRRSVSFFAALLLLVSLCPAVNAAEGYTDLDGHWAEDSLRWALANGLLTAENGACRPNVPVLVDEVLSALDAALGAHSLSPDPARLNEAATRIEAFTLLADAFLLRETEPDLAVLNAFTDCGGLSETQKASAAALVSGGQVRGDSGLLRPNGVLSRAEFAAVLQRLLAAPDGGTRVWKGGAFPSEEVLAGTVWLAGSGEFRLTGTAGTVIQCSRNVSVSLEGGASVERLILAGGASASLEGASRVGTLSVCGTGSTVNAASGAHLNRLRFTEASSQNRVTLGGTVSLASVEGLGNRLTVGGAAATLLLGGQNCAVDGSGRAQVLAMRSEQSKASLNCGGVLWNVEDEGIEGAQVVLKLPEPLPAGAAVIASVTAANPRVRNCTAVWTVDGQTVSETPVTVSPVETVLTLPNPFTYTEDMALTHQIGFTLRYKDGEQQAQTVSQTGELHMQNYDYRYYHPVTAEDALAAVTNLYAGDFTLDWALQNDYTQEIKELWVNAKGYSSTTPYLVWINETYQKVNVFEGAAGSWKLVKTFVVGTGAMHSRTRKGVFTVTKHQQWGWTTDEYCVRPVVRFCEGSGLAFHSRLYDPAHTRLLYNPGIGYPISHGCVRMYDEDVQWIFDNIPDGTTVVSH